MNKNDSLISILEFGSTNLKLSIYNNQILNQSFFYEEKIEYTKNKNLIENKLFNLILKAEKDLGQHLNEMLLIMDSSCIYSLDLSMQKFYDKKIFTLKDLDHLINECEQIVKTHNKQDNILHIIKSNINFDDQIIENLDNFSQEVYKAQVELKFIMINKKNYDEIKKLFLKKHISLQNIYCASYVKALGIINKLGISDYTSFIDIGFKKSSISIFKDKKLLYLNNIHIGGDHVTKDISKVLNLDYRKAEAEKLKFTKYYKYKNKLEKNDELLKNIINSRLEEIIELLFFNCPILKKTFVKNGLKLYFIGNGSKVLSENMLSFGQEFNFINEMLIIDENKKDCCDSALKYSENNKKAHVPNHNFNIENKGFFEKLFDYLSQK